jgi:hypothetical protein
MSMILRRLLVALPLALALPASLHADDVISADLDAAVPGTNDVTYLDLVRLVIPDVAAAGNGYEGHKIIDVRHIGGDDMGSQAPATLSPSWLSALPVQSDGKDRLLLLIDLGQSEDSVASFTVLALFSLTDAPTLLDAADVGYDRLTGFSERAKLSLGEGKNLVSTQSSHFNSDQNYEATALILVRNDHLQLVDTIYTFDDKGCGFQRTESPEIHAGDRDARTYSDIVAIVTETVTHDDQTCNDQNLPKESTRTFKVTYRWDEAASKFVADSDAFERLAKENEERF